MSIYIKPTSDIFVKYLFGTEESKDQLIAFINAVLEDAGFNKIQDIEIKNQNIYPSWQVENTKELIA